MEKTLIIIIMLIVLLSFTGCGGNEKLYGIYDVSSGKETTIGETKKNNMVISIPAGAFEQDVKITIDKVANNTEAYSNGKAVFLTEPFEIKAEGIENVRLNKPVTISMKLDRKNLPDNNTFDQYVMSYWTGDKWENIIPDPVKLSEGYLVFETWHFSSYSGKKMTDEEQVKEYARYLAMNDLAIQNTNPTLEKKIMAVVDDYLNGLSIYDKEARKQISDRVMNSSVVDIAVFASDHGLTTAQLGHKLTELIVQSTVDVCAENPLVLESVSSALDTVGDIAEASLALYDGDYKKAAGELTVFYMMEIIKKQLVSLLFLVLRF